MSGDFGFIQVVGAFAITLSLMLSLGVLMMYVPNDAVRVVVVSWLFLGWGMFALIFARQLEEDAP